MAALINNKPDLAFSYLGGNLIVTDVLEEYDNINIKNYVCLEYITFEDSICNLILHESLESLEDIQTTKFTLSSDGTHAYHRFIIPRVKKYANSGVIKPYNLFYYDKNFYYSEKQVTWKNINLAEFKKVRIDDMYETLEGGLALKGDNEVMYSKYIIFSYELLKKAFVNAQNSLTKSYTIKDSASFDWTKKGREKRDLLLAVLLAIREHIRRGNYEDAHLLVTGLANANCLGLTSKPKRQCACAPQESYLQRSVTQKITIDDLTPVGNTWVFGDSFPIKLS